MSQQLRSELERQTSGVWNLANRLLATLALRERRRSPTEARRKQTRHSDVEPVAALRGKWQESAPMNTPRRITIVTLGVEDLGRAADFYERAFSMKVNRDYDGVVFVELPGTWLSLFPIQNLAQDIGPEAPRSRAGFSGVTLAYNARSREEVLAIFEHLQSIGATVAKPPQETFWGGFSGYFADPDGYYWEVVWGPMFEHAEDGAIRFKR